ncbi:hypothetical protein CNR22_23285 [Sphingobacteriaceae bacterium]|nr:hypothetical protein CNR22_23285 [Sphingobacteriaceae bacterium]
MSTSQDNFLNRFTTIPFLMDMLTRQKLTLLNPAFWEDYNDRVTMDLYKNKKKAGSIYALCLSDRRETIHHWTAFANGTSGCCIEFDRKKLIECLDKTKSLSHGKVKYVKINDLADYGSNIKQLPYLKRDPFEPEREYRIIALGKEDQKPAFDVPLDINCIRRITLSSRLPDPVFNSVKDGLMNLAPEFKGRISHSTLLGNPKWINHFKID